MKKVPVFPRDYLMDLAKRLRKPRKPLKRKMSLRDSFLRKLKAERTHRIYRNGKTIKRVKPLKKVSRSHRKRLAGYYALQQAFLRQPENRYCLICTMRREHGENILVQLATEVHHWAGRIGRLLCYVPYFRPSCYGCRSWPHEHPKQARKWGILAPAKLWNVFPPVNGTD